MQEPPGEPTEDELRAALEEQMSRLQVEDVVLQTVATLVNLAARRLGLTTEPGQEAGEPDIDQARLAIDGVRALVPLTPEDQAEPIRQALSQLQMAFAQLAPQGNDLGVDVSPSSPAEPGRPGPEPPPRAPEPDEAERAKARSKIWTPRGT